MGKTRVLMLGPAPQVMGGISAAVQACMASDLPKRIDLKYLSTHADGSKLLKFLIALKSFIRFPVICFLFKPDLVHIHASAYVSFYRKSVLLIAAKLFRRKVIFHLNGSDFADFYNSNKVNAFLIRKIVNKADAVVTVSDSWKEWVNSYIGHENVFVLYNPVDTSFYKDLRPWLRQEPVKKILFMGIIGRRKGAYDIIKLIPSLAKSRPNIRFVFAGNGEIKKAKQLCKQAGILDKVEFPGWLGPEAKRDYYSEASIYLLPSYREGLPVSVLEAMAAGLPVVTTPVGGIPEAVEDGVNGYLIKPGDIKAMKEKLLLLLSCRDKREQFGKANKLRAKELFDAKIVVDQLCTIYSSIQESGHD